MFGLKRFLILIFSYYAVIIALQLEVVLLLPNYLDQICHWKEKQNAKKIIPSKIEFQLAIAVVL